jgi:hypothetical protein
MTNTADQTQAGHDDATPLRLLIHPFPCPHYLPFWFFSM